MNNLKALFEKYMNDDCTAAEIRVLIQHFNEVSNEAELKKAIATSLEKDIETADEDLLDMRLQDIYSRLKPALTTETKSNSIFESFRNYIKYGAAAAIFIAVSAIAYLYINNNSTKDATLTAQHLGNDVQPGGNKAFLTLADGTKLSLSDADNGELARQAGIIITKTKDGQLIYEVSHTGTDEKEVVYNTISTPAGGQYQVRLPDGTVVWLNALSSLTYPTAFKEVTRKVVLIGEGYFEVFKNQSQPFVVSTNGAGKAQEVTVLGTHFNINSYKDEDATKTTLIEGSVKVASSLKSQVSLKPGQQSILKEAFEVIDVDVTQFTDWRNDNFVFNNESIEGIMRKLARWYDIDVIYQGEISYANFGGEISRSKKLSEVLGVLEATRTIHFKIEGRRVTVMP